MPNLYSVNFVVEPKSQSSFTICKFRLLGWARAALSSVYVGIKIFLVLGVSFAAIACSSNKVPGPRLILPFKNSANTIVSWDIDKLSKGNVGSFVPVLDDNAIFTADHNGNVFRIDDSDGTIINKFKLHRSLSSGTAVSSDSIFVTTEDGYLLSINKGNGVINWEAILPTISIEAPQIGGDIVVVKTNDSQVSAYDAKSGVLLWVYPHTNPPLILRTYNSFQIIGHDVILLGNPGGKLNLLNLTNGNQLWQDSIATAKGSTDLDRLNDIVMRPVLKDKTVCVATYNGKIACLDALNSTVFWSKDFSADLGILIGEQNIYTLSTDGILFALDKSSGVTLWKNDILQYRSLSVPAFLGNYIMVVDNEGYINLFERHHGSLVARTKTDLLGDVSYPIADGNKVIVQSANGHLAKIILN